MPTIIEGIEQSEIHKSVKLLINNLVSVTDTTGEILLALPDGRVIDTKG
jgi:unsaturated rhamnogalacturonyl hydrolase